MYLQQLLPQELWYDRDRISDYLKNDKNIFIFLYGNQGEAIGYMFAQPHNDAYKELVNDDPLLKEDNTRFYIDEVVVSPDERGNGSFLMLIVGFLKEMYKRGFYKISSHILTEDYINKYPNPAITSL